MGRTVPSFRMVLAQEKKEWKPFRNALDKKERKEFDEMWDIARNYVSACSNSVQLVPLQPIIISILFHHYKVLNECMGEVETLGAKVNNDKQKHEQENNKEKKEVTAVPIPATTTRVITMEDYLLYED